MGTKNYYEIIAKCGHVGRKHYVPIKFAVIAEDGKVAAKKVRQFSREKQGSRENYFPLLYNQRTK